MNRVPVALVVAMALLSLSATKVSASLLTFNKAGQAYWNVLSLTDEEGDSALEIKKIAGENTIKKNESVALLNDSGRVFLSYGDNRIDLTGYRKEIVEIEEQDAPSKIYIEATEQGFAIKQRGITAETDFPITINSPQNKLSVETATGVRFISVLPYEVYKLVMGNNLISSLVGEKMHLVEKDEGDIAYVVSGNKFITLFKIFSFDVPIKAEVSAISGNVISVDQPLWYSLVGFFLA